MIPPSTDNLAIVNVGGRDMVRCTIDDVDIMPVDATVRRSGAALLAIPLGCLGHLMQHFHDGPIPLVIPHP